VFERDRHTAGRAQAGPRAGPHRDRRFVSSVMPAGGGRPALSVSEAMMVAAHTRVGETVELEITGIGGD
jgi:hypothetical protein